MGLPAQNQSRSATPPNSDDGWARAFAAANAGTTILDDPEAIEDRAILRWMKAHVLPRFAHVLPHVRGHQFILGNAPLPYHWMDQTIRFPTLLEARQFVSHLRRNTAAMLIVVDMLHRADGSLLICETVDASLDRLARMLMDGRLWLMPYQAPPQPDIGKTSTSVFAALNRQYGTKLSADKLSEWEGGQYLRGYVPFQNINQPGGTTKSVVAGVSGMTIATGFDIGQHSADALRSVEGLSSAALTALAPYAGKHFPNLDKAAVIARVSGIGPIPVIDKGDADALDRDAGKEALTATMAVWAAQKKPNVPAFTALPGAWQTVMMSRTYNQGPSWARPGSATQGFFQAAIEGRWRDAAIALRDAPSTAEWFRARVRAEAGFLATDMPRPVAPPAAAPGTGPAAHPP